MNSTLTCKPVKKAKATRYTIVDSYFNGLRNYNKKSSKVRLKFGLDLKQSHKSAVSGFRYKRTVLFDLTPAVKTEFDELSRLQEGWDGEDARPLTDEVKRNFTTLYKAIPYKKWHHLSLDAECNGTLTISSSEVEAGINIGNKSFSYYRMENDSVVSEGITDFTVENFMSVFEIFKK